MASSAASNKTPDTIPDTATDSKVTLFDIKNESANKPTPLPPYKFPSEGRQNIHAKSIGWDVGIDSSLLYPVLEWHCAGAKYEFVGDVGDIGPRNHELESQLFRKRFASMIGHEINQLSRFTVKVEGEAKIAICKDVSLNTIHFILIHTDSSSSQKGACTQMCLLIWLWLSTNTLH